MTDRTWLTVYAALAEVMAASQPYDAQGGFLLRSACATLDGLDAANTHAANRLHLVAVLDARQRHLDAARASMARLGLDLRRRGGATAGR